MVVRSGQASILMDNGAGALAPPLASPSTYVEDLHASSCPPAQRFAWDLLEDRRVGGAMGFFSRNLGGQFRDYENVPLVTAPTAGADSGRVMTWLRCFSCAMFPKPEGNKSPLDDANVIGGRFGAALAVAVIDGAEKLIVGSPTRGNGEVAVIDESTFRRWDVDLSFNFDGMTTGTRECQCVLGNDGNGDCRPWDETRAACTRAPMSSGTSLGSRCRGPSSIRHKVASIASSPWVCPEKTATQDNFTYFALHRQC